MTLNSRLNLFLLFCILIQGCSTRITALSRLTQNAQSTNFAWAFDATDSSSYSFNTTSLDFTAGVCRLKSNDQVDDGNTASGFAGGTLTATTWDATNSYVRLSQTGTPTNNAEFDSSWTPKWSNLLFYHKLNSATLGAIANGASITASIGPTGTTQNTNGTGLAYVAGHHAEGMNFDGVDDAIYFNSGLTMTQNTSTISAAAWIKPSAASSKRILAFSTAGSLATSRFEISTNLSGGKMAFRLGARSSDAEAIIFTDTAGVMSAGSWYHVVAVVDYTAKTVALYINGQRLMLATGIGFAANTTLNTPSLGAAIGTDEDGAPFYFSGVIDEVGAWNTALTAYDVAVIYERQAAKYSGTFASRVMDAFATGMSWTKLSWIPTRPFNKELTSTNELLTNYSGLVDATGASGNSALATNLTGLWHLNEVSGSGTVTDQASIPSNGTVAANVVLGRNGRIGTGATFDASATSYITMGNNLNYWKDDPASYSIWFKSTSTLSDACLICKSNTAGKGFWIGINTGKPYVGYYTTTVWKQITTTVAKNDGAWHHLAYTYDGSNTNAGMKIYIDGVLATWTTERSDTLIAMTNTDPLNFGSNNNGAGSGYEGMLDEVAIWSRVLHPNEIKELYRRGGNRVKQQARVCTAADCSDDAAGANWKGPDGTNQTYFSEFNNNSTPLTGLGSVLPTLPSLTFSDFTSPVGTSRYFQYRTVLESDDVGTSCNYGSGATWCSPELKSVTVDPVHYDSTGASVIGKTGVAYAAISSITETLGAACASGIGYNLGVGSTYAAATWYWWNGSAWSVANGTSTQSNPASAINTNAATFGSTVGTGTVYFKAFLKSSGTIPCEIDHLILGSQL